MYDNSTTGRKLSTFSEQIFFKTVTLKGTLGTGVIFPETDVLSVLQISYLSASSPVPLTSAITTAIKSDL